MQDIIPYYFVYASIYMASAIVILSIRNLLIKSWSSADEFSVILNILIVSSGLSLLYKFYPELMAGNLIVTLLILLLAKLRFKNYSFSGINFYLANFFMVVIGIIWGVNFMTTLPVSVMTKTLLLITSPLIVLTLPMSFVQVVELFDVLCRDIWTRPRLPHPKRISEQKPMVSIHIPTHSEPPDMVIETLNVIAQQEYKNFEVIVVDNNTYDEKLWKPLEEHCRKLGPKFRFFHLEHIRGAKAGALNAATRLTNKKASIISVIDADYHADPTFISSLIGYFDDPKMGFVQTPHDYRDYKKSLYLTMCYWEYKIFFYTTLVSMNERGAALTVGTMCLIRKQALLDAGGWARWCVTEDSELAIRIHDKGYSSVYVDKAYGKGLIPETFEAFKKQRYRWTAGPVQELRFHLKHFLKLSKKESAFTKLQRLHHFNHGLNNVIIGLSIPLSILSLFVVASMVSHHEIVKVPFELWLGATVTLGSSILLDWLLSVVTIKPKFLEMLGENIASKSLKHIITLAAFKTVLTGDAKWTRTNKFKEKYSLKAALYATKDETIIGIGLIAFIIAAYHALPYTGLALMFLIGLAYSASSYLAAPIMSIISVLSMKREERAIEKKQAQDIFTIPYSQIQPA